MQGGEEWNVPPRPPPDPSIAYPTSHLLSTSSTSSGSSGITTPYFLLPTLVLLHHNTPSTMIRSRTLATARQRRQHLLSTSPLPSTTRAFSVRLFPPSPPADPRGGRRASTSAANTDWLTWLKRATPLNMGTGDAPPTRKALVFAGLVSCANELPLPSSEVADTAGKLSSHAAVANHRVARGMGKGLRGASHPRRNDGILSGQHGRVWRPAPGRWWVWHSWMAPRVG